MAQKQNSPSISLMVLVARVVRRLRLERNISQEKFAVLAQLDRTYISGIERGRRNITLVTLDKLAQAFAISSGELLQEIIKEVKNESEISRKQ